MAARPACCPPQCDYRWRPGVCGCLGGTGPCGLRVIRHTPPVRLRPKTALRDHGTTFCAAAGHAAGTWTPNWLQAHWIVRVSGETASAMACRARGLALISRCSRLLRAHHSLCWANRTAAYYVSKAQIRLVGESHRQGQPPSPSCDVGRLRRVPGRSRNRSGARDEDGVNAIGGGMTPDGSRRLSPAPGSATDARPRWPRVA